MPALHHDPLAPTSRPRRGREWNVRVRTDPAGREPPRGPDDGSDGSYGARIPSLDGLRACSIALVILWHLSPERLTGTGRLLVQLRQIDAGNLGVRVFFVISGFLITTLLLAEHARTGRISLGQFYFRRTFRIMPAFYLFLASMALAAALGWQALAPASVLNAAMYRSDYLIAEWPVAHSWSLAVEEQFYLLWPGILVLGGLRGGFRTAAAMLVISPVLRVLALRAGVPGPYWPNNPRYAFECVADALATGCLLARARPMLWAWAPYRRLLSGAAGAAWPLAVLAAAAVSARWPHIGAAVGLTVANVAIAVGIDWLSRFPGTPLGRALNWRPVVQVGMWSYSLYLWQQPWLAEDVPLPLALRLAGLAGCALASYYVVEQPMLRLRSRLDRRWFRSVQSTASAAHPTASPLGGAP